MFSSRRNAAYTFLGFIIVYLVASVSVSVLRGYSNEGLVRKMIKRQYLESKIEEVKLKKLTSSMRVAEFEGFCILQHKEFRQAMTFDFRVDHPHFLNFWTQSEGSINGFKPARLKDGGRPMDWMDEN